MMTCTHDFAPAIDAIRAQDGRHEAIRMVAANGGVAASLTYADLVARMDEHAAAIAASTEPGDVVLLVEPRMDAFVCQFLGALVAGRWVLPIPPDAPEREVSRLIAESGARSAIGTGAPAVKPRLESARPNVDTDLARGGGIILRTSGTTGIPKLVCRTAASLDAVAANVRDSASLTHSDVILAMIPAWHSYGVENVLLGPLVAGASIACCPRFDAGLCARLLMTGATVFPGVPMMFDALTRASRPERTTLRLAYSAGSSLPLEISGGFAERWGRPVGQLYGASDVGSVTFNDPGVASFVPAGVGLPMRGVSVRILRDDGHDADADEQGEVAIRAPSMLAAYMGDHPMHLVDGHLRMGDLGCVDALGRLKITGMLKFLIDVGGMKVNPLEVECVLREHPLVGDCAVVALRVTETVSRVRAIVTPAGDEPPDASSLRAWSAERLAPHKVPRVIDLHDSLPRSPTGKLLRRALEEA